MRREEARIVKDWVQILLFLHQHYAGLTTRQITDLVNEQVSERVAEGAVREILQRNIGQVRSDLVGMLNKGLVTARREGQNLHWTVIAPEGLQPGLWGEVRTADPKGLARAVKQARRRKGCDAREFWWTRKGKKAFRVSQPGARIDWSQADEILVDFRGNPKDLEDYLAWGWGSIATWSCGCCLTTRWGSSKGKLTKCGMAVCERMIALNRAEIPEKTLEKPGELLRSSACLVIDCPPRDHLKEGDEYQQTCRCRFVVARVVFPTSDQPELRGVITPGLGQLVCHRHEDQVYASWDL